MNDEMTRRQFFHRLSLILTGLAGLVVSVPILAYLFSPLINPARHVWRSLGPVDSFDEGKTVQVAVEEPSPLPWAGQTAQTAVWVRRERGTEFTVFAVNCTHLGCPVNWLENARLFVCPCHGGVFYADGRVAAGPPPEPLVKYEVRVQDGEVQVRTRQLPPVEVGA